jgi:hypothetical protein
MNINMKTITTYTAGIVLAGLMLVVAPHGLRAQQAPGRGGPQDPAPTGPLAPEKYKNIQVLTNVQADQLDATMRYVSAATSLRCVDCHVQESTGQWSYEKDDKRTKQTARGMMKMVLGINAANYGVQVQCDTCHAGHNRPTGLPMAEMLTPEQVAQMNAPAPPPGGGFPGGGFPGGPAGASGGGRGPQRPPAPAVDDVLNKYLDAIGGRAAVEKLQSLSMTGSVTDRAGKTAAFTIEEKANKYRESRQSQPAAMLRGFDGANGWSQTGAGAVDLTGFLLDQSLRLDDMGSALHLKEKYTNLQTSNRPMQINGKDTVTATGRAGFVSEQFSFDSASGLLLRRVIMTRTVLGTLREQIDYSDYRSAGDVKIPFQITSTTWNALDTYKVADAKANVALDDARFAKPR